MKEFSELIKNIDILRRLIREFFVFGYKTRGDFDHKSGKTFDNDRRRIQNYFDEFFFGSKDKYGKRNSIMIDSDTVGENPLYRLYKSKSFTANDLVLHCLIIDAFQDLKSVTAMGFADYIGMEYGVSDLDLGTIRLKLNEYVQLGVLKSIKQNKKMLYSLNDFDVQNVLDTELISFFSEVAPLGVIGSYILDRTPERNEPLIKYKHRLLYAALDSFYLLQILEAIENREVLKITQRRDGVDRPVLVVPLKILLNRQNGREYVACFNTKIGIFTICRFDHIIDIAPTGQLYDVEPFRRLQVTVEERLKKTWNINFAQNERPQCVEFVLYVEDNEPFILTRLQREGHEGEISSLGNNLYRYQNEVYDPSEMIPWIKSFIGRLVSVSIEDEELNERLHKDILSLFEGGEVDEP